jgi:hypothetical protein
MFLSTNTTNFVDNGIEILQLGPIKCSSGSNVLLNNIYFCFLQHLTFSSATHNFHAAAHLFVSSACLIIL